MKINSHSPEEQPSRNETLVSLSRGLLHDVQVWRVEAQGSGGQTVSDLERRIFPVSQRTSSNQKTHQTHQVDPQQLHGNKGFGQTQGGGQEDRHHLTDVRGDQVADELLHVVVDGTALLNGRHNGGEVVVGQHHLGGGLGHGSSRSHSNTNFGLLQGGRVIHTVTSLERREKQRQFSKSKRPISTPVNSPWQTLLPCSAGTRQSSTCERVPRERTDGHGQRRSVARKRAGRRTHVQSRTFQWCPPPR